MNGRGSERGGGLGFIYGAGLNWNSKTPFTAWPLKERNAVKMMKTKREKEKKNSFPFQNKIINRIDDLLRYIK